MRIRRLLVTLTVVNLTLLVVLLAQTQLARAFGDETPAVLRGRALQIVDERDRPGATISVLPATVHEGVAYPETVLLRLIDRNGRPEVKIGASVDGGGVGLVGQTDTTHAALIYKCSKIHACLSMCAIVYLIQLSTLVFTTLESPSARTPGVETRSYSQQVLQFGTQGG